MAQSWSVALLLFCISALQLAGVSSQQAAFFYGKTVATNPISNGGNLDPDLFSGVYIACRLPSLGSAQVPPTSIYQNNTLVTASTPGVTILPSVPTETLILFSNITAQQGGDYECRVSGTTTAIMTLRVRPYIVFVPPEVTVFKGSWYNSSCYVHGYPSPVRLWPVFMPEFKDTTYEYRAGNGVIFRNCSAQNAVARVQTTLNVLEMVRLAPAQYYPPIFTYIEGTMASIPCEAVGDPISTYTWSTVATDGTTTPVAANRVLANHSLLLRPTGEVGGTMYRCTVRSLKPWNLAEDAQTPLLINRLLNHLVPPQFTLLVRNRTIAYAPFVRLIIRCEATGIPVPTVNLYRNGQLVTESTQTPRIKINANRVTVGFPGIQLILLANAPYQPELDSGIYHCVANNSIGVVSTSNFEVLINSNSIASQPTSQVVVSPAPIMLLFNVTGYPPPHFQWYHNGTAIPNANRPMLTVTSSAFSDSGAYHCIMESSSVYSGRVATPPTMSLAATVTVQVPARVTIFTALPSTAVTAGSPVNISCEASAHPPPVLTLWKNGVQLEAKSTPTPYTLVRQSAFKLLLIIPSAGQSQHGIYMCNASNVAGTSVAQLEISVPRRPSVLSQFTTAVVAPRGRMFRLACNVTGQPAPTVVWTKRDAGGRSVRTLGYDLVFDVVQATDAGTYMCTATNPSGVATALAIVAVQDPAALTTSLARNVSSELGGVLVAKCVGQGNPQPSVRWYHLGAQVTAGGRIAVNSSSATASFPPGSFNVTSEFRLSNVRPADFGSLSCSFSNVWNTASSSANFLQLVAPATPQMGTASNATTASPQMSILLQWPAVAGVTRAVREYRIRYQIVGSGSVPMFATTTTNQIELTGLAAETTYTWSVRAENAAGVSLYSTEERFTTAALPAASASKAFYTEIWFYSVVGGVGFLILNVIIILCCCCCKKTKTRDMDIFDPDAQPRTSRQTISPSSVHTSDFKINNTNALECYHEDPGHGQSKFQESQFHDRFSNSDAPYPPPPEADYDAFNAPDLNDYSAVSISETVLQYQEHSAV